ncbi:MAG: hypothetical protein C5B43_01485, partial [Verrucomicrobia bacterium]
MDLAIVTGADTGIGLAISKKLITLGFRVHAFGDNFSKTPFVHRDFLPTPLPNTNPQTLTELAQPILENSANLTLFINAQNNTTSTPPPPPGSTNPNLYSENLLTHLNHHLIQPFLLTHLFIDKLKQSQGLIINLLHENPTFSPFLTAINQSLSAFYNSLSETYRQQGINVIQFTLNSLDPAHSKTCDLLGNTIDHLIRYKGENMITNLTIRPQNTHSLQKIAHLPDSLDEFKEIQLPTKSNFPKEQQLIETPKPTSKRRQPSPLPLQPISFSKPQKTKSPKTKTPSKTQELPKTKKTQKHPLPPSSSTTPLPLSTSTNSPSLPSTTPKLSRDTVIIPRE